MPGMPGMLTEMDNPPVRHKWFPMLVARVRLFYTSVAGDRFFPFHLLTTETIPGGQHSFTCRSGSWQCFRPITSCHIKISNVLHIFRPTRVGIHIGYGSIPINTIFRGMNIHLPAILMWTTGVQGFDTLPYWVSIPIGSMYGIYANIWGILMVNVAIYSSTMDPMGIDLIVVLVFAGHIPSAFQTSHRNHPLWGLGNLLDDPRILEHFHVRKSPPAAGGSGKKLLGVPKVGWQMIPSGNLLHSYWKWP